MSKRDGEAEGYVLWAPEVTSVRDVRIARAAFIAGWNARKQLDYEAMLGVKRPLHASAYEPLTPFKPRPAPLGDTHFGDGSPTRTEPLAGCTAVVVHGGDLIHGKLHDE